MNKKALQENNLLVRDYPVDRLLLPDEADAIKTENRFVLRAPDGRDGSMFRIYHEYFERHVISNLVMTNKRQPGEPNWEFLIFTNQNGSNVQLKLWCPLLGVTIEEETSARLVAVAYKIINIPNRTWWLEKPLAENNPIKRMFEQSIRNNERFYFSFSDTYGEFQSYSQSYRSTNGYSIFYAHNHDDFAYDWRQHDVRDIYVYPTLAQALCTMLFVNGPYYCARFVIIENRTTKVVYTGVSGRVV